MENKYIFIKNQDGGYLRWRILEKVELKNTTYYEIRYNGYVTTINEMFVYEQDGKLMSDEVRKTEFDNGNFGITPVYGIIGLES